MEGSSARQLGKLVVRPVPAALGGARLRALYGISIHDSTVLLLLRHRGIMFGLLGGFLIYASSRPQLQPLALAGGAVSALSFLWLAQSAEPWNNTLRTVVVADVVALTCLAVAAALYALR